VTGFHVLRCRPGRSSRDTAVADYHDESHPVLVYAGDSRDTTTDFISYAAKLGISPGDCLVLAHAQATLPKTHAGAATPPSSKAAALAWAVGIITDQPMNAPAGAPLWIPSLEIVVADRIGAPMSASAAPVLAAHRVKARRTWAIESGS